jgi:hypothetical protein
MGKHSREAPEGSTAEYRNLNAVQFAGKTGSTVSANTGKRAKPQPTTMGSPDLRARWL